MTHSVVAALAEMLPAECLVTDPDRMESYRFDRAAFCPAGQPLVVVRARETAHVSATLRVASEHRIPVVPQGARSGLSGAANAIEGGIVLSLELMDRVLRVDVTNRYTVTQPGAPAAQQPATVAATFADARGAAEGVSAVLTSGVIPSLLEFMDRTSVHAVNDSYRLGFGPEVGALVIGQSDAADVQAKADVAVLANRLEASGALDVVVADDPSEGELLLSARRQVLTAFERVGTTLIDDVCVPRDRLADLVGGVEALGAASDLLVGIVGHAGDGNFHPTVVFDASDAEQVRRAHRLFDDIMVLGLELGGTITGEHGVGILKRDMLRREIGELGLRVHRDIKTALDPLGILNPGKVLHQV